jgi:acyl transferase domain-containing protein
MASVPNGNGHSVSMSDKQEPMAIIGMATRFPQEATNTEKLWEFLLKGRSAHTPFPKDRINPDGHYHPDPEHGGTVSLSALQKAA